MEQIENTEQPQVNLSAPSGLDVRGDTGRTATANSMMRAEFQAWVRDCGCDTDGAWSAWQAAWNRRAALASATAKGSE